MWGEVWLGELDGLVRKARAWGIALFAERYVCRDYVCGEVCVWRFDACDNTVL